jgi:hypothetical protein
MITVKMLLTLKPCYVLLCITTVRKPQHAADTLWACGLLQWHPGDALLAALTARCDAAAAAHILTPELNSAVVWSLQRLNSANLITPALHAPLQPLPFSVHQQLVPDISLAAVMQEIDFKRDEIRLGGGEESKVIAESRLTAWQSCTGMAFEYSGKVMPPTPMTETTLRLRAALLQSTGVLYDGVVRRCAINIYVLHHMLLLSYHAHSISAIVKAIYSTPSLASVGTVCVALSRHYLGSCYQPHGLPFPTLTSSVLILLFLPHF